MGAGTDMGMGMIQIGARWASRTFFSDNGSTAIEIALKMAFRKFLCDHGILLDLSKGDMSERCIELKVSYPVN
ncbi:hypothetical protein CsSME_00008577 [Camellia sinensis var. sinensis]